MNDKLCVWVGRIECLHPKLYDNGLYANVSAALTFEEVHAWLREELAKSRQVVEDFVKEHSGDFKEVIVYGDDYERSNSYSINARTTGPSGGVVSDQIRFWQGGITCHSFPAKDVMAAFSSEVQD